MEKQVEQEAAYPIPISLYRTVRHEKRYQEYSYASLLMPHCPVTVVQKYRDGVCSLLFHLFFIICHPSFITRVYTRGRSRRGTQSKMASFIVDSCRDQRFALEMWDWRRTIAWGRCTPLTIVDQFGIKISGFTPSY